MYKIRALYHPMSGMLWKFYALRIKPKQDIVKTCNRKTEEGSEGVIFDESKVFLDQSIGDMLGVFRFIAGKAYELGIVKDEKTACDDLLDREKMMMTGLQDYFAIPHCRTDNVQKAAVFYLSLTDAIEWESFDNKGVKYIFCIMAPEENSGDIHLRLLSVLAAKLIDENFRKEFVKLRDKTEIVNMVTMEEET